MHLAGFMVSGNPNRFPHTTLIVMGFESTQQTNAADDLPSELGSDTLPILGFRDGKRILRTVTRTFLSPTHLKWSCNASVSDIRNYPELLGAMYSKGLM